MGSVILCFIFKFGGSLQDAYFSLRCFPLLEFYCMHAAFYRERAKLRVGECNVPGLKSSGRKSASLLNLYDDVQYLLFLPACLEGGTGQCCQTCLSCQLFQKRIVFVLQLLFIKLPHNAFTGAGLQQAQIIIKCLFIVTSQDLTPCA